MTTAPSYCLHRPTGQADITLRDGRRRKVRYLGKWGTEQSLDTYAASLAQSAYPAAEIDAAVRSARRDFTRPGPQPLAAEPSAATVRNLSAAFMRWGWGHYRLPNGQPSRELQNFEHSFRECLELLGDRRCCEVTKRDVAAVRERMVERLSRKVVNQRVSRILHVFRWGSEEERGLVPELTAAVLHLLKPLQAFRTRAADYDPVPSAPAGDVERVIAW